jgi:hypothetical protein
VAISLKSDGDGEDPAEEDYVDDDEAGHDPAVIRLRIHIA